MISLGPVRRMLFGDDAHAPVGSVIPIRNPIDGRIRLLRIEDVEPHWRGAEDGRRSYLLVFLIEGEDERAVTGIPKRFVYFLSQCVEIFGDAAAIDVQALH